MCDWLSADFRHELALSVLDTAIEGDIVQQELFDRRFCRVFGIADGDAWTLLECAMRLRMHAASGSRALLSDASPRRGARNPTMSRKLALDIYRLAWPGANRTACRDGVRRHRHDHGGPLSRRTT